MSEVENTDIVLLKIDQVQKELGEEYFEWSTAEGKLFFRYDFPNDNTGWQQCKEKLLSSGLEVCLHSLESYCCTGSLRLLQEGDRDEA
ncbi:MAG: hypothetical protein ACRCYP_01610 [Alphaproteobacteria bacterium]